MRQTRDMLVFQLEDMITDRDRWKALAECACDLAEECYPYVDPYFIMKWGLEKDIAKMRELREKLKSEMEAERL